MSRWSFAKLLELLIAAACLFLHHEYLDSRKDINLLCSVTFVAYTIILLVLIVGYFISKPFSRRVDILFGVITIPLFLASGYFILTNLDTVGGKINKFLNDSEHKKQLAKGWLAVANGVIFILDVVFHCFE